MARKTRKELSAEINALAKVIKLQKQYRERGLAPRQGLLTERQIAQLERKMLALKRQRGDYRPKRTRTAGRAKPSRIRSVVSGGLPTLGKRGN